MWHILPLIGLAMAGIAGPARAEQLYDGAAIRTLLVGKSALFSDYSVSDYRPDGRYSYVAANNLLFRGKYAIEGDKLCITLNEGGRFCEQVGLDAQGLFMLADDGRRVRFSIASGIMPRETAKLCGMPLAYNLTPPASDAPEKARAFAGVWMGRWDDGLCSALVVESVQANGVASLIYVHGSVEGAQPISAGAVRLTGTIVGNKLSNGAQGSSLDYVLHDNELEGSYRLPASSGHGRFRRVAQQAGG